MSTSSNAVASGSAQEIEQDADTPKKTRTKKGNAFPDRLLADPASLDRLRQWTEQATSHFDGAVKPTRNDIANAILVHHAEDLSADELSFIWKRCFNPVKFLKSTAAQMQKAQERGESVTLDQVIDRIRRSVTEPGNPPQAVRKRGRKKAVETASSDAFASPADEAINGSM